MDEVNQFLDTEEAEGSAEADFGFIYIAFNPSMPGLLKIGFTSKKEEITK